MGITARVRRWWLNWRNLPPPRPQRCTKKTIDKKSLRDPSWPWWFKPFASRIVKPSHYRFVPKVGSAQAEFHDLTNPLHKSVKILSLSMAAPQGGNGRDIIAVVVSFNDNRKLSLSFHTAILARREPRLALPQLLKEQTNRLNPTMKIRNMKLLIRSMQIIVRQPKPHHHRRNLQHILKIRHNRNRST